jgi:hypothetical protein
MLSREKGEKKMDIGGIIEELRSESPLTKKAEAEGQGGVASDVDPQLEKLAKNLVAGGKIFARGIIAGIQEKVAEAPVSASGQVQPSVGDASKDDSMMKKITDKVLTFKGHESPGSAPSVPGSNPGVVAEQQAPTTPPAKPNPDEPTGG